MNDNGEGIDRIQAGLERAARNGIKPATIVDIGAGVGGWSQIAMGVWPGLQALCFEPAPWHRPQLEDFQRRTGGQPIYAMAGDKRGRGLFWLSTPDAPWVSHGVSEPQPGAVELDCSTIDDEVRDRGLPGPYLLKLDTHGFEARVLDGARESLKQTCLIVVESYFVPQGPDSLAFWDLCKRLERDGFRPTDFTEFYRQPGDGRLFSIDFIFERA